VEENRSARARSLARITDAWPEKVFRAWTEPALRKHWFILRPWAVDPAERDVRPGGSRVIVMRSPEGEPLPNRGVHLEPPG